MHFAPNELLRRQAWIYQLQHRNFRVAVEPHRQNCPTDASAYKKRGSGSGYKTAGISFVFYRQPGRAPKRYHNLPAVGMAA